MSFLRGRTEFGDSIEDEWVIVWLLREISKKFAYIWIKVSDSDGEFLLIEASGTIPAWLEPEVAENRVWINDGKLKIIKPTQSTRAAKRTVEKLSLQDAQQVILTDSKRIMHSESIQEEAFYRLRNYPAQIAENMHHALARIPRKVAFLLLQKPAYIAPAIEAFYLRDPIALKPLQKQDSAALLFPPADLVTLSVKFPKVGYAQVKSQQFQTLPVWKSEMPSKLDSKEYGQTDIGMKVTSGFEMLLTDSHHQDLPAVREMKLLLEDLESGDDNLPTDAQLGEIEKREDDEKWLDIDFDDLDHELGGKSKSKADADGKKREFGDKAAQENLQRIVKQFEDFLNTNDDGPNADGLFEDDSDELGSDDDLDEDDDDGEDKEASFDEDEFTKMMQEMMGMPSEVMKEVMLGNLDALSKSRHSDVNQDVRTRAASKIQELDTSDEEDSNDLNQMEAELRASGVLDLRSKASAGSSGRGLTNGIDDAGNSSDEDQGDDFDADFARNILQSFRSGGGMGGPAANLLNMMSENSSSKGKAPAKKPK